MKVFSLYLIVMLALLVRVLADRQAEEILRHVVLKDNVNVTMAGLIDHANFAILSETDQLKVDADLAQFKIERVSDAFLSKDGRYVLTFAKDFENSIIKRVIFFYNEGQTRSFADNVIEVSPAEIKSSRGTVKVGEGNLIAD